MFGIPDPYTPLIKVGAVLAVAAATAFGIKIAFDNYNEAIVAKARLEDKVATLEHSKNDLQAMLDEADELAKKAQRDEATRRRERDQARMDLDALLKEDPVAKNQLTMRFPDSFIRLRQQRDTGTSGSVPRPNGPTKPNARPGP